MTHPTIAQHTSVIPMTDLIMAQLRACPTFWDKETAALKPEIQTLLSNALNCRIGYRYGEWHGTATRYRILKSMTEACILLEVMQWLETSHTNHTELVNPKLKDLLSKHLSYFWREDKLTLLPETLSPSMQRFFTYPDAYNSQQLPFYLACSFNTEMHHILPFNIQLATDLCELMDVLSNLGMTLNMNPALPPKVVCDFFSQEFATLEVLNTLQPFGTPLRNWLKHQPYATKRDKIVELNPPSTTTWLLPDYL